MIFVTLSFTERRPLSDQFAAGHKAWLKLAMDDGYLLAAGGLADNSGGALLIQGLDEQSLNARLQQDPFVSEGIVSVAMTAFNPALQHPTFQEHNYE